MECVLHIWNREVPANQNPLGVLHIKLGRTIKALRAWSNTIIPQRKLVAGVCRAVVDQLEKAPEGRPLSTVEHNLIKDLKDRFLGLNAIQKCRARSRSRLTWLKKGDVNTRYFHIMATMRKRKNFIHSLQTIDGITTSRADKHKAIFDYFVQHIGSYAPRQGQLNLSSLGWHPKSLQHLDAPVSKSEVISVIKEAPKEKAPGSDDYIGLFFSVCWDIIKDDLLRVVGHFFYMN
jgi:hypothetical protein